MAPTVTVIGQDRFLDVKGHPEMRLLGIIPVASDSGTEMDQEDLLRYLYEIMWFPSAAISPSITWEPIDATSARVTIQYGNMTVSATFVFKNLGHLSTMTANRFDRDHGSIVPWSTPIKAYETLNGLQPPIEDEAIYRRDTGDFAYIFVRVTAINYNQPFKFYA